MKSANSSRVSRLEVRNGAQDADNTVTFVTQYLDRHDAVRETISKTYPLSAG